jgi:hypothetical protein
METLPLFPMWQMKARFHQHGFAGAEAGGRQFFQLV